MTPDVEMLTGLDVLVVEDESMVSMLIQDILASHGCRIVETAARVKEALEKVGQASFNVAIVDINLNGESSIPIIEALVGACIPLVVATGYGSRGLPPQLGELPILQKPFTDDDLIKALVTALKKKAA
jgi:CheY-like chemotaxis protein